MSRQLSIGSLAFIISILVGFSGGCTSQHAESEPTKSQELPPRSFTSLWRANIELDKEQQPQTVRGVYLSDDYVFVQTNVNRVYVLSRPSGRLLFIREIVRQEVELYGPVVFKDWIVWPSATSLFVYDKKGKMIQEIPLPFALRTGAVGSGNRVYAGADFSGGGRVAAIDITPRAYASRSVWELMTFGGISATPALFQGLLYCGSRDGRIYAVRAEDRAMLWPNLKVGLTEGVFATDAEIVADVKADKDGVYIASMDTKLYCLDLSTGKLKWQFYAGQQLQQSSYPVPTPNSVYIYVPGSGIVAIDKAGQGNIRKSRWAVADAKQFLAEDDRAVYLRRKDNAIIAVDKADGSVKFASQRKDLTTFALNMKDGIVYASTADGDIVAIIPVLKPGTVGPLE